MTKQRAPGNLQSRSFDIFSIKQNHDLSSLFDVYLWDVINVFIQTLFTWFSTAWCATVNPSVHDTIIVTWFTQSKSKYKCGDVYRICFLVPETLVSPFPPLITWLPAKREFGTLQIIEI